MKLCAHTMGMPHKDIYQCISLCAQLGHDGIEVRCAEDGQIHLEELDDRQVAGIRNHAETEAIEIACLTPYYRDFTTTSAAEATLAGYELACRTAQQLGCSIVRAISGSWPHERYEREEVFHKQVRGIRRAARIADQHNVVLAVETHKGQLTWTARQAVQFIRAVDHPAVRILWDHFWVHVAGEETLDQALDLLAPYVVHIHAKNLTYDEAREYQTVLLDEGVLNWGEIIERLHAIGYTGYISDEYEKFWRPDELPATEVGMKRNWQVLREGLDRVETS